jgi:hypothetical protein
LHDLLEREQCVSRDRYWQDLGVRRITDAERRIRVTGLECALYEKRTLVRTLGMRRTMFVLPTDLVPIVQAACTDAVVPGQRKRLVQEIETNGIARAGADRCESSRPVWRLCAASSEASPGLAPKPRLDLA